MRIAPAVTAPPVRTRALAGDREQQLIERMQASKTVEVVRDLSVAPRVWKTEGHERAVQYVITQLQAAGWEVHVEELPAGGFAGGKVRNVVAERRGTGADGQRGLVIAGAHLDSVRGAPGANDDGTGSATLIELARSLAGMDTRNDIRLIWFDGEEAGLLGSRAHVKAMSAEDKARAIGMVNMDMIGSIHGKVGFDLGMRTPNSVADVVRGVQQRTGLAGTLHDHRHNRSDHASFDAAGIPSIDFGVGLDTLDEEDPYYHSPKDTVDKINLDVLEGYGDLIAATVLDAADRDRRFGAAQAVTGAALLTRH